MQNKKDELQHKKKQTHNAVDKTNVRLLDKSDWHELKTFKYKTLILNLSKNITFNVYLSKTT